MNDIVVESIADSSAVICWNTNVPAAGHIAYGISESLDQMTETEIEDKEIHSITLEELVSDTLYYFQIVCTDSFGQHVESDILTFRTDETTGLFPGDGDIPEEFRLCPNYPNPFNGTTCLEVVLPESGNLQAMVYNISGQEVYRLYEGVHTTGVKRMVWDGINQSGEVLVSGVYIARILFEGKSGKRELASCRLVIIR